MGKSNASAFRQTSTGVINLEKMAKDPPKATPEAMAELEIKLALGRCNTLADTAFVEPSKGSRRKR